MKRIVVLVGILFLFLILASCSTSVGSGSDAPIYNTIDFDTYEDLYKYFIDGVPEDDVSKHLEAIGVETDEFSTMYHTLKNNGKILIPFFKGEPATLYDSITLYPRGSSIFYDVISFSDTQNKEFVNRLQVTYLDETTASIGKEKGVKAVAAEVYKVLQKCTLFTDYRSIKKSTINLGGKEVECLYAYYDKDVAEIMHAPGEILIFYENILVRTHLDHEKYIGRLETLLNGLTFEYFEPSTD